MTRCIYEGSRKTGGINITSIERAYMFGPYSVAYFYVDVEGFDSPEGIKGRWMLAGVFGPQSEPSAAYKAYYGWPVRPGASRSEPSADVKRAVGTVNGQDFVTVEYRSVSGSCKPVAVLLNYISLSPERNELASSRLQLLATSAKRNWCRLRSTLNQGMIRSLNIRSRKSLGRANSRMVLLLSASYSPPKSSAGS